MTLIPAGVCLLQWNPVQMITICFVPMLQHPTMTKKSLLTDLSTPCSLKAFLSISRNLTSLFCTFTPRSRVCKLLLGQKVKCWVTWSSKQVFQKQISKGYETSVIHCIMVLFFIISIKNELPLSLQLTLHCYRWFVHDSPAF